MALRSHDATHQFALHADTSWAETDRERLDPGLYWVVTLVEAGEWDQVYYRTGMRLDNAAGATQYLPLLAELQWTDISSESARELVDKLGLQVPEAYLSADDASRIRPTYVTARLAAAARGGRARDGDGPTLRQQIANCLAESRVARLELPGTVQACNEAALADVGLVPATRTYNGQFLDGAGVVIGIIDDGCALAHRSFLTPAGGGGVESRVSYLWDQAGTAGPGGGWTKPVGYYGVELGKPAIDAALAAHNTQGVIDEDAVYAALGYVPALDTHGTHVMDIAAGNGDAAMGAEGMAPAAEIIFVQLPAAAIAQGGHALDASVIDGVDYIFRRAGQKRAVINLSYGGYFGPHDGSSIVERAIDARLAPPNRAVVVAAGNAYEADCHARETLRHPYDTLARPWRWILKPEDPTPNDLEIWYGHNAELALYLTAPDGTQLGPVSLGAPPQKIMLGAHLVGSIVHRKTATGQRPNHIRIHLNQTIAPTAPGGSHPAAAGTWQVQVQNVGTGAVTVDAWIQRDTSGRPGGARRQQSHFHPDDADPRCSLSSYATGLQTVVAGAYNTATHEVCRYSACGPTRDGRPKPDVLAPAEEDAADRGILSAAARLSYPTRMNGTSAAAPQVAGLVALLLQYAASIGDDLTAIEILELLKTGAQNAPAPPVPLRASRHVNVDVERRLKQGNPLIWHRLIGNGRISWPDTIGLL
jgi:subtilisin family serine protease